MPKLYGASTLIPDQRDRIVLITGASSGIGKEAARVFAQKNAKVIIAVRNVAKGQAVGGRYSKAVCDGGCNRPRAGPYIASIGKSVRRIDYSRLSTPRYPDQ